MKFTRMHRVLLIVFCLFGMGVDAQFNSLPYTGSKLIRLNSFNPELSIALESFQVTYLSCRSHANTPELIVQDDALRWLDAHDISYDLLEEDLKQKIDREQIRMKKKRIHREGSAWYNTYRTYEEVQEKLYKIADENALASSVELGLSFENRKITGLKLSTGGIDKPAVFFNGCQHAREWITVMASVYLADHFVEKYQSDVFIQNLLDVVDVYVVPIVNPDGYVYTHTSDRFWRKNRQSNDSSSCVGIDLNRNWDADWNGGESTSSSTCSDVYVGEEAFSARETQIVKNFMETIPNLKGHLDIHSYSALVLGPWGYTNEVTPDHEEIVRLGESMNNALSNTYNYPYFFGTGDADGALYLASGTMPDWSYDSLGAFGFTYELRPQSWEEGGFELPESKIIIACEENYKGTLEMVLWAAGDVVGCTDPDAFNYDAMASIDDGSCLTSGSLDSQTIVLPRGWKMISSNIQPLQPSIEKVLAPIQSGLIVAKNGAGAPYLPQYNYNGIGDVVDGQAYHIKLKNSDTLIVKGLKILSENFEMIFNEGWNMMAYLNETPSDVHSVFSSIKDEIIIVKSSEGLVYIPDLNYNALDLLNPGEGYQIKLRSPISYIYEAE